MNMKWFGNHCIDIDRIESVSLESGGNIDSTYSLKANLTIRLKSGNGIRLISYENDGYEEFYYYWTEIESPKPDHSKVSTVG